MVPVGRTQAGASAPHSRAGTQAGGASAISCTWFPGHPNPGAAVTKDPNCMALGALGVYCLSSGVGDRGVERVGSFDGCEGESAPGPCSLASAWCVCVCAWTHGRVSAHVNAHHWCACARESLPVCVCTCVCVCVCIGVPVEAFPPARGFCVTHRLHTVDSEGGRLGDEHRRQFEASTEEGGAPLPFLYSLW